MLNRSEKDALTKVGVVDASSKTVAVGVIVGISVNVTVGVAVGVSVGMG